jgi:hypothetical protein
MTGQVDTWPVFSYNAPKALRRNEMDCPNCGVYNPKDRTVCWRCDKELPKPVEPKKKKGGTLTTRNWWIIMIAVLFLWLFLTFILPMLLGGGGTPTP